MEFCLDARVHLEMKNHLTRKRLILDFAHIHPEKRLPAAKYPIAQKAATFPPFDGVFL